MERTIRVNRDSLHRLLRIHCVLRHGNVIKGDRSMSEAAGPVLMISQC